MPSPHLCSCLEGATEIEHSCSCEGRKEPFAFDLVSVHSLSREFKSQGFQTHIARVPCVCVDEERPASLLQVTRIQDGTCCPCHKATCFPGWWGSIVTPCYPSLNLHVEKWTLIELRGQQWSHVDSQRHEQSPFGQWQPQRLRLGKAWLVPLGLPAYFWQ